MNTLFGYSSFFDYPLVFIFIGITWFLFFKVRALEENFLEEKKSLLATSCAAPLFVSIMLLSLLSPDSPVSVPSSVGLFWISCILAAVLFFVLLCTSYAKAKKIHHDVQKVVK